MVNPGTFQELEIVKETPQGLYLRHPHDSLEILLPNRYVPETWEVGQLMKVFLSLDGEQRLVATTDTPKITLYTFAFLEIVDVNKNIGAFADWGLPKHLLIPFNEQPVKMEKGKRYCIFLDYEDETDRLFGSGKYEEILNNDDLDLTENQAVDALIIRETQIGYQVIINNRHLALLYKSTLKKQVFIGERYTAYVTKLREDNKIDITLQKPGFGHVRDAEKEILEALERAGGFLQLHDKSTPEDIEDMLEMSKKTFKKAVGVLYRLHKILIEENGIRLKKNY